MGNKIGTFLCKHQKNKKPKKVGLKKIFQIDHKNNENDAHFTPVLWHSQTEEEQDNKGDDEIVEEGQTSASVIETPTFLCEICVEQRPLYNSFNMKGCPHFYCIKCTVRYVASKLGHNITCISCPVSGCEGVLEPEYCRDILPKGVFDRWGIALCESVIAGSKKFYCPFKDCSALLINEIGEKEGTEKSKCPSCKREFCVKCKVPWHSEFACAKFQKLKKKKGEDGMLEDLAKRKKWRRCPNCKYYVEKSVGCFYIKCRCGNAFCYNCGSCSSTTSHVCPRCKH